MQGMTKRERQVTDPEQIRHILDTARVLHLGLAVNNEPYVVPLNYGYIMENGKLVLYLHSAQRGKKLDMLRANPNVFFEMDCDRVPFESKLPCQYGMVYSSIMGRGVATIVEDVEEKKRAMPILSSLTPPVLFTRWSTTPSTRASSRRWAPTRSVSRIWRVF